MDPLKLFYEQQLENQRRRTRDRGGKPVAALEAVAVESRADGPRSAAAAPPAAERADPPELDGGIADTTHTAESEDGDAAELLLRHVERHAGQPLRTRASIDAYFAAASKLRSDDPVPKRALMRETVLVLFLAAAVLQYYYMDVSLQIASLKQVTVFVPVQESRPRGDGA